MESPGHVAIIGGGIIGISTAFYLCRLGHTNVSIYEQCGVACHSSGKAGGFLARKWCDDTDLKDLARTSFDLHMGLMKEFPDLDYRGVDTYQVNTSNRQQKTSLDNPIKWVSDDHLTGVKLLDTENDTAKVSPKMLCNKLLSVAQSQGIKLNICKIVGVKKLGGRVNRLLTSHGETVSVDSVVIATGPWSTTFVNTHFPESPLPVPRPQTRAHSVVLRPNLPLGNECIFHYHNTASGGCNDPEIYPVPDGTVYVCGEIDYTELPENPRDITPNTKKCHDLIKQAGFAAKCLLSAEIVATQACYLPGSRDDIPIIGKISNTENVYIATGHTFWGILNGPATGKCLAELILHGESKSCDISKFNPDRFI